MNVIAYYLGQYHPLEENNQFWGEGFTEWHNVSKARPLFPKHVQPVLPGALGFYDLRCDETLIEQQDYAKSIGVSAFCHWHYWFSGKRVLYRPLDRILELPDRGVKMMLGWANESWTGIWHGLSNKIIFKQSYDREELNEHAKLIASYLRTGRFLRTGDGFPFLIYKPRLIPDCLNYLSELRERVLEHSGERLYIIGCWGPGVTERIDRPSVYGLDAVVANNVGCYINNEFVYRLYIGAWHYAKKVRLGPELRGYKTTMHTLRSAKRYVNGTVHSTVVTGWDNTPRSRRRGLVLLGYNKKSFGEAIRCAVELEKGNSQQLLFVKSWNEWAEGNTIEPKFKESWSAGDTLAENLRASGAFALSSPECE